MPSSFLNMDEKAIAEFVSLTGTTRANALRALHAADGDLQVAVERFLSNPEPTEAPSSSSLGKSSSSGAAQGRSGAVGGRQAGIKSLGDYDSNDKGEDEDDTNEYFAGGERSGQVVRGAPPEGGDDNPFTSPWQNVFDAARRYGAEERREEEFGNSGAFRAFSGRGRTIGGASGSEAAPPSHGAADRDEQRDVTIAFYENLVFTVDDGEPRRMDDPANKPFLSAIMMGRLPSELDPGDPRTVVNVNLVQKHEPYDFSAKPKFKAFTGAGRKLNTSEDAIQDGSERQSVGNAPASGSSTTWEGANPKKTRTTIQLRLRDGSRLVAEFNMDHTVGDIRRFIQAARPDLQMRYTLSTAFPRKELEDDAATIEAAGLSNSVIIQK